MNSTWILKVFLASRSYENRLELRSCMSKCGTSYLFSSKVQKWNFKWYSILLVQKTWIFQFFKLVSSIIAILEAPFWASKSKKCTIINFKKKLKILIFIIFAQNAPVLKYNGLIWNGIRFLTMISFKMWKPVFQHYYIFPT